MTTSKKHRKDSVHSGWLYLAVVCSRSALLAFGSAEIGASEWTNVAGTTRNRLHFERLLRIGVWYAPCLNREGSEG